VRDRGVTPIEQPEPLTSDVDVRHVQVVVLNRLRDAVPRQLVAQLGNARGKPTQKAELVAVERQIPPQEILIPLYAELQRGEARYADTHRAHGVPDLGFATLPAR
jgi:hypothetical protein